jgi:glycosyltransferase involved in cell wall biosynthesis
MDIAIIPAYNPDVRLFKLATELHERGIDEIVVVNDGSEQQTLKIFDQLRDIAIVLTHDVNQGKGAAIKTALKYISDKLSDIAYNMDGGKSSVMTFADAIVNQPSDGGREVSDSILIKEVE